MKGFEIKYGIVSDVKKGYIKAYFEEDGIVSNWLPVLVRKSLNQKESWQLEVNEHVVCLMDGGCEEGVCIGAIPSDQDVPDPGEAAGKFRKKFSDGTVFEYDLSAHKATIDVKGQLEAKTSGAALVDATTTLTGKAGVKASVVAPNIELSGNVTITGMLTVAGATTAAAITAASLIAGAIGTTGGGHIVSSGDFQTGGSVTAGGDVVAGGKSLKTHTHPFAGPSGTTGTPV